MVNLLRERGKSVAGAPAVTDEPASSWTHRSVRDLDLLEHIKAEAALLAHTPTIEDVRTALMCIPGSMSDTVTAERGEF